MVAAGPAPGRGGPPVRIATTPMLLTSGGAVAGPTFVASLLPILDAVALVWVVVVASALTAGFALRARPASAAPRPSATPTVVLPATSVAPTEGVAEVYAGIRAEAAPAFEAEAGRAARERPQGAPAGVAPPGQARPV